MQYVLHCTGAIVLVGGSENHGRSQKMGAALISAKACWTASNRRNVVLWMALTLRPPHTKLDLGLRASLNMSRARYLEGDSRWTSMIFAKVLRHARPQRN